MLLSHFRCWFVPLLIEAIAATDAANAWYWLGGAESKAGNHAEAITAYQEAIRLDSSLAAPHYSLGNIYSLLGQLDEAEQHYRKVVEMEPQCYSAMASLSRIARQRGDDEAAAQWIAQARPLLPEDDLYNRACVESIAGNRDAALDLLQRALEDGKESKDSARQDPDFVFIRDDLRFALLVGE